MKDLPKVFANNIRSDLNNTQDLFYGNKTFMEERKTTINIVKKINEIFASTSHVYKSRVEITLKDSVVEKILVGKTSNHIITMDGEYIRINDILDIKKI